MKNILNIMEKQDKIKILLELRCDEKYTNGMASDFELFDEWERCLCLAAGHGEIPKYRDELDGVGLTPLNFGEYSKDKTCKRWQKIHGEFYEDETFSCAYQEESCREKSAYRAECFELDIEKCVTKYITQCESYAELSERIRREAATLEKAELSVKIDISQGCYRRPDPHTAELAFNAVKTDENYNYENIRALCLSTFTELLISEKSKRIHGIRIHADGNSQYASELVDYVCRRGFFEGEAFLEISSEFDTNTLSAIVERAYPSVRIIPVLNGFGFESLKDFAKIYPIGACVAGIGQDNEELLAFVLSVSDGVEHAEMLMNILNQNSKK